MERIEKLKSFLKEQPEDSFLQHALALEYVKMGQDDEARKLFEAILQREPSYTGSYYHLGKLLERAGLEQEAIAVYEKGMAITKQRDEQHAYSELRGALEELTF